VVLPELELGEFGAEIAQVARQASRRVRERSPANQDQEAQNKAEHPMRVQPPCQIHLSYPRSQRKLSRALALLLRLGAVPMLVAFMRNRVLTFRARKPTKGRQLGGELACNDPWA
jgi:hypothetical protein